MAENTGQERTESATPKKRAKAREEGQVARSMDVISVLVLGAGLAGLALMGPTMTNKGAALFTNLYRNAASQSFTPGAVVDLAGLLSSTFFSILAPFVGLIMVFGVMGNVSQTGLLLTTKPLMPKFNRISPATGAKRIFSKRGGVELVKSLLKITVVAAAMGWAFAKTLPAFFPLMSMGLGVAYREILIAMLQLAGTAALALVLIALLDFWFQRYEHEEQLKMTKQEVKDEHKQSEGDPQLKGKIREKMRAASRARMMEDLKDADVVVTNPIRFAVALKYDPETMRAPKVVAKGARLLAARIRQAAREAGVPVLENPPLARALYKAVEVGSEVPLSLYQTVAELLAFVWKQRDAAKAGGIR